MGNVVTNKGGATCDVSPWALILPALVLGLVCVSVGCLP
jgi:hypothetical protein